MSGPVKITAGRLVEILEGEGLKVELSGDGNFEIDHLRDFGSADEGCLTFFIGEDPSQAAHLKNCVLICLPGFEVGAGKNVTRIFTGKPKLAFYILCRLFEDPAPPPGIHPTAVIHPEASVHPGVSIGPFCSLGKCVVEDRVIIHPQVTVYDKTRIGAGTIIESNSAIGPTGQIWAWDLEGRRRLMPQFGGVTIEEECFIGSNVSIVRGAIQDTVLKKRCRIAHGSMIGHNCTIGVETFTSSRVAITGSCTVGDYCFFGSGSIVRPGITLGNYITVGAGAVVTRDYLEDGLILVGIPARVVKKMEKGKDIAGVPSFPAPEGD